ncbi:MAG: hypothetical protein ACJA2W_001999 [Planctomycetota bacterium]
MAKDEARLRTGLARGLHSSGDDLVAGADECGVSASTEELDQERAFAAFRFELDDDDAIALDLGDPAELSAKELSLQRLEERPDGSVVALHPTLLEVDAGRIRIRSQAQPENGRSARRFGRF